MQQKVLIFEERTGTLSTKESEINKLISEGWLIKSVNLAMAGTNLSSYSTTIIVLEK